MTDEELTGARNFIAEFRRRFADNLQIADHHYCEADRLLELLLDEVVAMRKVVDAALPWADALRSGTDRALSEARTRLYQSVSAYRAEVKRG